MKIAFVLGTRPEIIKLAPVIKEAQEKDIDFFIVHTNQHYDKSMDEIFFQELQLPESKYNLNIGSGMQGEQTGNMLIHIEKIFCKEVPDVVVVQGDTNSVLAGALAASKLNIKVGHIEAGLRSYDKTMPEETNRILTDHMSTFLFCPTKKQAETVVQEGISPKHIFVTGNTIVDSVKLYSELAEESSSILDDLEVESDKYFLFTCHRPSNTDDETLFREIINTVDSLAQDEGVVAVFPVHPRLTKQKNYISSLNNIKSIDPVGYLDLLKLQKNSRMIFTDSGGIQEESCILKKKCVILRTNTERPETVEVGGATLLNDASSGQIMSSYNLLRDKVVDWQNPFGAGTSSEQILDIIIRDYE